MEQTVHILRANLIFTPESHRFEVIPHGYVVVRKGKVEGVWRQLPEHLADCPVTDWGDRLLIPAMNDMHVHASQYHNQGIAMDEELLPWLQNYTFPEELKYADTAYAERMYRLFIRDLWRHGTMRVVAFATAHLQSTRILMHLLDRAGMGGRVGQVYMNRNCPVDLQEGAEQALQDCDALVQEFEHDNSRVRPIVTPRFIPSCTPELLEACGEMARRYHLPVQSHLSENLDEIAWVRQLEPQSQNYADAYDRYGLLGQTPTVMAHCVWTDDEELELLRQRGVMVAHCPTSNFNLASGLAPIRRFLDAGIPVGLGSDISGGHDLSIFRMMVYAVQVSKMHYQRSKAAHHSTSHTPEPFLTLSEAFWIATKSAGRFFGQVGSFEPGYDFDALVIDDSELVIDPQYSLVQRLERFVYLGDDRHIIARYCQGRLIPDPGLNDSL